MIVLDSEKKAEALIAKLGEKPEAADWGKAFNRQSITAPDKPDPNAAPGLLGDLGLVTPPGDQKGANAKIPDAVRRAVFELGAVGDVAAKPAMAAGKAYVVRLSGRSKGHTRSLAEAERSIRVALLQDLRREREQQLEAQLRKRFPVRVDDAALKTVKLPGGVGNSK